MAIIVGKNSTTETLTGSADSDTLIGGAGTNTLVGGAGADIFKLSERLATGDASRDIIEDFQIGLDKIDVSAWGISSFDQFATYWQSGSDVSYIYGGYNGKTHIVAISNIVGRLLSASDFIFSTSGARTEVGMAGSDVLFGSTGNDSLNGADGADRLFGGNGNDLLTGGDKDYLYGGEGADTFVANTPGYVYFSGQGGNDIFKVSARSAEKGNDTRIEIDDFQTGDKIDVRAFGISSLDQVVLMAEHFGAVLQFDAYYGGVSNIVENWGGWSPDRMKASDFIFDMSGAKKLVGTEERDRLFGSLFNDVINGGGGDDQIFGGAGNDLVSGGSGKNALYGQAGNDTFKLEQRTSVSSTNIVMDFQAGVDKIDVSAWGISSFDQLKNLLQAKGADTIFQAAYGGADHVIQINKILPGKLAATDFIFYTGPGQTQTGTNGRDVLFGGNGTDILNGGAGDAVFGGAGNDVLSGGTLRGEAGADTFKLNQRAVSSGQTTVITDFQKGVDKVDVSAWGISSLAQIKLLLQTQGTSTIFYGVFGGILYSTRIDNIAPSNLTATDFVFHTGGARTQNGTAGSDWLFGGAAADTLNGAVGDDRLYGGEGNDNLIGGEGSDTLYGEGGADTFKMVQKSGARDNIVDFQIGLDKIDISTSGVTSFDQLKVLLQVKGPGTTFRIYHDGYDQEVWIMNVALGKLTAGDFVFDQQDLKVQTANASGSLLFGGKGANTLLGGIGNDTLFGGAGNDILSGGLGSDKLYGQSGADIFRAVNRVAEAPIWTNETNVADFEIGIDRLDVSGFGITSFDQLKLVMYTSGTSTKIRATYGSHFEITLSGVVSSKLTARDFIFATQEVRNLSGTEGSDYLFGGAASDKLSGGFDDDALFGGAGSDTLAGGTGINDLFGQGGADIFKMSKMPEDSYAEDTVHDFELGLDKIDVVAFGISSFDQLQVIMFDDEDGNMMFVASTSGDFSLMRLKNISTTEVKASDFIFNKQTAKAETGTRGSDDLFGTTGADTLNGAGSDDWVFGGGGNDKLFGGDGSDALIGGAGTDSLTGGAGKDGFMFNSLSESGTLLTNCDVILDFSIADQDRIYIRKIDANTKVAGDQAFSFIGQSAFTNKAGELRFVLEASDTYIYGDVNGDGKADFSIRLDDAVSLTKDQFIL